MLYAGQHEFVAAATSFVNDGVVARQPTLVVVDAGKIASLQASLDDLEFVYFADMADVGSNPARIIPAWREFVAEHNGRGVRGIGEPISPRRGRAELVECQRHESLLNLAFADTRAFWLLCPYDTAALEAEVVVEAHRSHPFVLTGDVALPSAAYRGLDAVTAPFDDPLPPPPPDAAELAFGPGQLPQVRAFVADHAGRTALSAERADDVVLAVNELVTNSLLHGGANGTVWIWDDGDVVVCEVHDAGEIADPLIGRLQPDGAQQGGRGLWMVNHLCELVQVRSSPAGTDVRVHVGRY